MRKLAAALIVGLVVAVPTGAEAAKRDGCHPRGSKTISADRSGRVYTFPRRRYSNVYGCLYRSGRQIEIDDAGNDIHLASPYVVYTIEHMGGSLSTWDLDRFNLRTRKTTPVTGFGASWYGSDYYSDLALTHRGTVVWVRSSSIDDDVGQSVRMFAGGRTSTLDPGPSVDRGSLAVTPGGRRAYWTHAGEPRFAPLP